jgi:hypothetical protein
VEGYWSAIPRRCRYDDEEEESAGVKRARVCRDLGVTATRILASRDQLRGNFEIVLPLVSPGEELSKSEFKEKIKKWREALQ